jgi:hypothetical protein
MSQLPPEVDMLPFGANAKQSIAYLMTSRGLSVDDAILELERLAGSPEGDKLLAAASRKDKRGIRE